MKVFHVISDKDIFQNSLPEPKEYMTRPTAKGLVFDSDGKIALVTTNKDYLLPGGGVESDETFEQAFIRECDEEIGCKIEISETIGKSEQYRNIDSRKYEIVFFVAKVLGEKGLPSSKEEDEQNIKIIWVTLNEAINILKQQMERPIDGEYSFRFNVISHLAALETFLGKNEQN